MQHYLCILYPPKLSKSAFPALLSISERPALTLMFVPIWDWNVTTRPWSQQKISRAVEQHRQRGEHKTDLKEKGKEKHSSFFNFFKIIYSNFYLYNKKVSSKGSRIQLNAHCTENRKRLERHSAEYTAEWVFNFNHTQASGLHVPQSDVTWLDQLFQCLLHHVRFNVQLFQPIFLTSPNK